MQSRRATPFQWGVQDCATFACDAVIEMIGQDPWAAHRGTYSTEADADAIVTEAGGLEALAASIAATIGLEECGRNFVHRGDFALVEVGNQRLMGIVLAGKVAVPGADGVQFVPMAKIIRAWAV